MSALYYIVIGTGSETSSARQTAPLQHVSVTGLVRDTLAQYTLVQTYINPRTDATIEAVYTFPLYEGVAVSGFEAEVDGRKIVGRVQERVAARKEYKEAVKEGKVASLLEQERPDVFQASIGNIPPGEKLCISITLVSEIKLDAEENHVRLVLPTAIAPRYGSGPERTSNVDSSASKLSVSISCAMSKPITSIQSPSHTIEVHLGTSASEGASTSSLAFEPNRARVSLTADCLLDKDLVIIIQSLGLDAPRALVECHPTDGTHAVSLTFAPRFALNPIRNSELIFVVDRSGSMEGAQIKQAGEALELFLRSIPVEDHSFNIIGFGSTYKTLFPNSVAYNAESLKKSTSYAQKLRADMGATELTNAFRAAFRRRRRDVPTQIFLLTDGQIWDVDALGECIREAVEEGEKSGCFVRVFSLGVGASVSHHLIESVARAGGGYAQFVVDGERMEKKVVNMLKAAMMPPVTNVGVEWTCAAPVEDVSEEDFEMVEVGGGSTAVPSPSERKPTINLYNTSPEVVSPPLASPTPLPNILIPIQQAPFKVPSLYRGAKFTIYAILSSATPVPGELVLRGSSPDGPVELKVNIESVQKGETMLHSLAARTLVRDLEEGSSCIHALGRATSEVDEQMLKKLGVHVVTQDGKSFKGLPLSSNLISDITNQKILELALKYNLSSKFTSWVAIDTESQQSIIHNEVKGLLLEDDKPVQSYIPYPNGRRKRRGPRAPANHCGVSAGLVHQSTSISSQAACAPQIMMMCAPQMACAPQLSYRELAMQGPEGGTQKKKSGRIVQTARKSVMRPHSIYSAQATSTPVTQPLPSATAKGGVDSAFLGLSQGRRRSLPDDDEGDFTSYTELPEMDSEEAAPSADQHARLRSILQHQHFDGLFPLNSQIAALFSSTVEDLKGKLGEVLRKLSTVQLSKREWETVWATCLAVDLMRKQLPELQEEWELIVEKAEKGVGVLVKSPPNVAAIQQAASELLEVAVKAD